MRFLGLLLLLGADDGRGWTPGSPASQTAAVLAEPAPVAIQLPRAIASQIDRPTVLFYFAPNCPHCQQVAREVAGLSDRLLGYEARLIWVASGTASDAEVSDFKKQFGIKSEILIDRDRELVRAMGARSTPSAVLVAPRGGEIVERDRWYPYQPGYDSFVEARVAPGGLFALFRPSAYQGTVVCGSCHEVEAKSWQLTHHSVAWRTLQKQEATAKPECVGCHVIGLGKPGGWSFAPDDPLVDVGCEACHGPGGPHDGMVDAPRDSCAACHDAAHSVSFDLARGVQLLDHYRASSLTPELWRAARIQLLDGQVPREMLAFHAGPTVGSQACAACHPIEHTQWRLSAHAEARASLGPSPDPACVVCHATPLQMGGVGGQREDESVGCETCHGPGDRHVASAGGVGTIEGLGEDCPVCVIEAICTNCHTKKWDPDWDLDASLPVVRHR